MGAPHDGHASGLSSDIKKSLRESVLNFHFCELYLDVCGNDRHTHLWRDYDDSAIIPKAFWRGDTLTDFNNWDFDYDGWTMGEDALYMQLLERCRQTGEMRPLYSHWSRMIRHWPYA